MNTEKTFARNNILKATMFETISNRRTFAGRVHRCDSPSRCVNPHKPGKVKHLRVMIVDRSINDLLQANERTALCQCGTIR